MLKKLINSPLTYALAQIKFSNIESIENYIPELQEDIRGEFPFFNKIKVDTVQIQPHISPIASSITLWHFMDKESVLGILLDTNSITIHTSKYINFTNLAEKFKNVLISFNKRLKIAMCTRIGLRYVNVITSELSESIKPELLGFNTKSNPDVYPNKFLAKTEVTQESNLGIINIKSLHFGNIDIMRGMTNLHVTPELSQMSQFLSFEHHSKPTEESLILDIDHYQNRNTEFSIEEVIAQMSNLQEVIYKTFCLAITDKAIKKWSKI